MTKFLKYSTIKLAVNSQEQGGNMEHQNLSDELNRIVGIGDNKALTLDLRTVSPGDKLKITLGVTNDVFTFTIIEPAKEKLEGVDDSAIAFLPGKEWSEKCPDKQVKVLVACACTFNPYSPLRMTMMHIGHLSVGRHFAIWKYGTDSCQIFRNPIIKLEVIKAGKQK